MSDPAIELRGLQHRYDASDLVLRDVDLTIETGEIFGFLGHNGAGKTTAMNILTTLLTPTAGTAKVCGFDVVTERHEVTRRIGYLPADVRMYGHLTAAGEPRVPREAVRCPATPARQPWRPSSTSTAPTSPSRRVGTFSTGMRQRIGIAQAIVHGRRCCSSTSRPPASIRSASASSARRSCGSTANSGMTVFMNTHLLSEVAKVCTTIGVLNHGELIYKDTHRGDHRAASPTRPRSRTSTSASEDGCRMIATIAGQQSADVAPPAGRRRSALAAMLVAVTVMAGVLGWSSHHTIVRVYDEATRLLAAAGQPAPPNPFLLKPTLSLLSNMVIYIPLIGALLALVVGHLTHRRRRDQWDRPAGVLPAALRATYYAWARSSACGQVHLAVILAASRDWSASRHCWLVNRARPTR